MEETAECSCGKWLAGHFEAYEHVFGDDTEGGHEGTFVNEAGQTFGLSKL